MMFPKMVLMMMTAVSLLICSCAEAQENVSIKASGAWVRLLPPVQKTTGAYVTLTNQTAQDRALVAASSSLAREVQLHEMSHADGMMKMRQVEQIVIPAKGKVELKSGGYHLMLIDLKEVLKENQEVSVVLGFDDGSFLTVLMPVKTPADEEKACH